MTLYNSIQPLKTISKLKMFHKNFCIEPPNLIPKSLQKFSFILPTRDKFSSSIYPTIHQFISYSLLQSNLRLLNYTLFYLTIS